MKDTSPDPNRSVEQSLHHQGVMTSSTLMDLIRDTVSRQLPGAVEGDADKTTLLLALLEARGPAAVVEVGLRMRTLSEHPILDALVAGDTPGAVLERWMRLECFGHTRHRTRIVRSDQSLPVPQLMLQHFAIDGGPIHPVNDLFIWGLLIALIERAGFSGLVAMLEQSAEDPTRIYDQGETLCFEVLPQETAMLTLRWDPSSRESEVFRKTQFDAASSSVRQSLSRLFMTDLVRSWRLNNAAHILGVSPRGVFQDSCRLKFKLMPPRSSHFPG